MTLGSAATRVTSWMLGAGLGGDGAVHLGLDGHVGRVELGDVQHDGAGVVEGAAEGVRDVLEGAVVLEELAGVVVLDAAVAADEERVLALQEQHGGAVGELGRRGHLGRDGEQVALVGAVDRLDGGGGHHLGQVVDGGAQERQARVADVDLLGLALLVPDELGHERAVGGGAEVGHLDGGLGGVAGGGVDARVGGDGAREADGLALDAGAVHDAVLQAAAHGLAHDGADVAVQEGGAELEHVHGDRGEAGELALGEVHLLEGGRDLLGDLAGDGAPHGELARVLVAQPLGEVAGVHDLHHGEQRVLLGEVLHDLVDDGGGHDAVGQLGEVGEGLHGLRGLERVDDALVVALLGAGQLSEPALREGGAVGLRPGGAELLGEVGGGCGGEGAEGVLHLGLVAGGEGLGELAGELLGAAVEVDGHLVPLCRLLAQHLGAALERVFRGLLGHGCEPPGLPGFDGLAAAREQRGHDGAAHALRGRALLALLADVGGEAEAHGLLGVNPRLCVHEGAERVRVEQVAGGLEVGGLGELRHLVEVVGGLAHVGAVAGHGHPRVVNHEQARRAHDALVAGHEDDARDGAGESLADGGDARPGRLEGVVDGDSLGHLAAEAVDVHRDGGHGVGQLGQPARDVGAAGVGVVPRPRGDVPEDVQVAARLVGGRDELHRERSLRVLVHSVHLPAPSRRGQVPLAGLRVSRERAMAVALAALPRGRRGPLPEEVHRAAVVLEAPADVGVDLLDARGHPAADYARRGQAEGAQHRAAHGRVVAAGDCGELVTLHHLDHLPGSGC
nr:MAG TPA: hypothetical protein [Caudoviricetes sp.]